MTGVAATRGAATFGIFASKGLVETVRVHGQRDVAVTLTDRGRELLEANRRDGRRRSRRSITPA